MIAATCLCIEFEPWEILAAPSAEVTGWINSFVTTHQETGRLLGTEVFCSVFGNRITLVYTRQAVSAVQLALDLMREADRVELPLQMGIHTGLVVPTLDPLGQKCFIGLACREAEALASLAESAEILLSKSALSLSRSALLPELVSGRGKCDLGPPFGEEEVFQISYAAFSGG